MVEIKVGVKNVSREVVIETQDKPDQVEQALTKALADGGTFVVTGERGRKVIFSASDIGYVEIGEENARPVGFGSV